MNLFREWFRMKYFSLFLYLLVFCVFAKPINAQDNYSMNLGEKVFQLNCSVCHSNGQNIIPEKNLKLETLKLNGMDNVSAIIYQVTNGKNGMPAFGSRLTESEITEVSSYVLQQKF